MQANDWALLGAKQAARAKKWRMLRERMQHAIVHADVATAETMRTRMLRCVPIVGAHSRATTALIRQGAASWNRANP